MAGFCVFSTDINYNRVVINNKTKKKKGVEKMRQLSDREIILIVFIVAIVSTIGTNILFDVIFGI